METINPAKREDLFAISATKTTIAERYKELASIYHPDTHQGSNNHMTQVNQAYQILKNNL